MRELKYSCGCHLCEQGIIICSLHLVMFEDLLLKGKYKGCGWDVNQEEYTKIVHCLNVEEEERRKLRC